MSCMNMENGGSYEGGMHACNVTSVRRSTERYVHMCLTQGRATRTETPTMAPKVRKYEEPEMDLDSMGCAVCRCRDCLAWVSHVEPSWTGTKRCSVLATIGGGVTCSAKACRLGVPRRYSRRPHCPASPCLQLYKHSPRGIELRASPGA